MFAARQPASLQTQLPGNTSRRVEVEYQLLLPAFCVSAECRAVLQMQSGSEGRGEEKRSQFAAVRRREIRQRNGSNSNWTGGFSNNGNEGWTGG